MVPTPTGTTETAPQSATDDSTTTVEPVSLDSDAVFDFATDSLCDRISGRRVAEIVETAFRAHDATPVPSGFHDGGGDANSPYRYCGWDFEGGVVGLVETEPAEEARSQLSFVTHAALSPGVMVSEERLGDIGESGEFIDGLEVRLLVEGQDSTVEFWHTAPVGYTGDESALLAVADGLMREMGWVPTEAGEVFSFAENDLCEWVGEAEVAEWVSAEFDWEGVATDGPVRGTVGCEWMLESADGETDRVVTASDASLWQDFDGNTYDVKARLAEAGLSEYPPRGGSVEIGAWVVGHPSLSIGVVAHNGGFGTFAFGVPPGPWLQVSI